ncbi:hypothetical protein LUZ60_013361 [Juncus effusus]|nr:hypothetical protein LUZ60_013361 [Juncus effusus]
MASWNLPWFHYSIAIYLSFSLFHFSSLICTNGQRIFLYPQSDKVSSIVSKQYRTSYHFQPPENWINGPMYFNGMYHLFYQYNPNGSLWGDIIWAHSVSTDLINWIRLEPALTRTSNSSDIIGCWSGSATILSLTNPVILYTGANSDNQQVQNMAVPKNRSDPFLREWIKLDQNPLIRPIDDLDPGQFRDPTTGWLGPDGLWRIAVGAELNGHGAAILYKSEDFIHWNRTKMPLHYTNSSKVWECPDFYPVLATKNQGLDPSAPGSGKEKHVLKMSLTDTRKDYYLLGSYDEEKDIFVPDKEIKDYWMWPRIDFGNYYASKSFFDSKRGRRILCGWTNESDSSSDDVAKGWAGIHAIPRSVWLDQNGKQLIQWPVEEIESLRANTVYLSNAELKSGSIIEINVTDASQADVEVEFVLPNLESAEEFDTSWLSDPDRLCETQNATWRGAIGPFGLYVLTSKTLDELTAVFFRVYKDEGRYMVLMCADLTRSSLREGMYRPAYGGFLDIPRFIREKKISLRTLIDHSVVESFGGGGRACITSRVYPLALTIDKTHIYAFNYGSSTINISDLTAWTMKKATVNQNKI